MQNLYFAVDLEPADLGKFLSISRTSFLGFNVTAPYKRSVMAYLDSVDRDASRIGAVNLVLSHDGKLVGGNTDYSGFGHLLKSSGLKMESSRICIRGTGGAFRSVYAYITDNFSDSEISVISRSPDKLSRNDPLFRSGSAPEVLDLARARTLKFDILINCSPIGMLHEQGELPFPPEAIQKARAGIDLIYNPQKTPFLAQFDRQGKPHASGLSMFSGQAYESFRRLHGVDPGLKAVDEIIAGIAGGTVP